MNSIHLIGNLTKDPEVRYTTAAEPKAIGTFTIEVSDGYGKDADAQFINIKTFGATAENCSKYLAKGRKVAVTGKLKTCYKDAEGKTKYYTEVLASQVEFMPKAEDSSKSATDTPDGFSKLTEDEVPF